MTSRPRLILSLWLLSTACTAEPGSRRTDTQPGSSDGATVEGPETAGSTGTADVTLPATCQPGKSTCQGNAKVLCSPSGTWGTPTTCPAPQVCDTGVCHACQTGQRICQGQDVLECGAEGQGLVLQETCADHIACIKGNCVECAPGARECRTSATGVQEAWECQATSETAAAWKKTATCPESAECQLGLCLEPCAADVKLNTNQGCDYYAVDLENVDDVKEGFTSIAAANAQFAVVLSNPSATKELTVTVHETAKGVAVLTKTVPPKGIETLKLGPRNIKGTLKAALAWRLKGNRPFVAYQFNPLDNENPVYSNDATLLLPTNAIDSEYLVMTGSGGGAFVTIVGTKAGTSVTVVPTGAIEAGGGIPAIAKGESFTTTLDAGEVLNLKAAKPVIVRENLTGTRVTASANVSVFAGNVCTTPVKKCCCDHLEMQLFPTSTWGMRFVAGRTQPRGAEPEHWRILALEDDTHVSFSGGVDNPVTLARGTFHDLATKGDFLIEATKPVLVGEFIASSYETLTEDAFCATDAECPSGVCSGQNGTGECLDTCTPQVLGCTASEYCVAGTIGSTTLSPEIGICSRRICGEGYAACSAGAVCSVAAGQTKGQCYTKCKANNDCAAGAACTTTSLGMLCAPAKCAATPDCGPGALCVPSADPAKSGACAKVCTAKSNCLKAGALCAPPGYTAGANKTSGVCSQASCLTDADCEVGRACYVRPGASGGICNVIGDPSFILAVPIEQWRKDYVFLTPTAYSVNYVNVLIPKDATVDLDGKPVGAGAFVEVPGAEFRVARLLIGEGTHTLVASAPVGIIVYGFHKDVSYGYPGGANLTDLKTSK